MQREKIIQSAWDNAGVGDGCINLEDEPSGMFASPTQTKKLLYLAPNADGSVEKLEWKPSTPTPRTPITPKTATSASSSTYTSPNPMVEFFNWTW